MKTFAGIAAALCLASCGGDIEGQDHGYGLRYDFAFADGTRFRNNPPVTIFDELQAKHYIADVYREVEECAQIFAPGPLTITIPNGALGGFGGMAYPHDGLIIVTDNSAQDGWDTMPYSTSPLSVLRHEMVHHLLGASGFPDEANAGHRSPLFVACSGSPGIVS